MHIDDISGYRVMLMVFNAHPNDKDVEIIIGSFVLLTEEGRVELEANIYDDLEATDELVMFTNTIGVQKGEIVMGVCNAPQTVGFSITFNAEDEEAEKIAFGIVTLFKEGRLGYQYLVYDENLDFDPNEDVPEDAAFDANGNERHLYMEDFPVIYRNRRFQIPEEDDLDEEDEPDPEDQDKEASEDAGDEDEQPDSEESAVPDDTTDWC